MTGFDLLLARKRAKLGGHEVAKKMGVTRQYVAKLEAAGDQHVSDEAAVRYLDALAEAKQLAIA